MSNRFSSGPSALHAHAAPVNFLYFPQLAIQFDLVVHSLFESRFSSFRIWYEDGGHNQLTEDNNMQVIGKVMGVWKPVNGGRTAWRGKHTSHRCKTITRIFHN
jgi:hypothetical protein